MKTSATPSESPVSNRPVGRLSGILLAVIACVFAALAALPALHLAYQTWTTDPLRSVGVLFPVVAVLFAVRGFRNFRGPMAGTLWGLLPAALAITILGLREFHEVLLRLGPSLELDLLPAGLAISLLCGGIVLLIGGLPLLRGLIFPVVLLGLTNPVPHFFSNHLDLPLQQISAGAARRFAVLIGEHPTGEQLQLMFTPDFGMFIAPGCNGIRGAVTLGYLALFAAIWRRLRPWVCAGFFAAGIALGYIFNFLRLFVLVLYYRIGESVPSIRPYGTGVDYAIGGTLFLLASYFLGRMVFHERSGTERAGEPRRLPPARRLAPGMVLLMAICVVPAVANLRTVIRATRSNRTQEQPLEWMPSSIGPFHLVRQWDNFSEEHIRLYHWGLYSDGNGADDVSVGLWMPPNEHDVRYSHAARGDILIQQEPIVPHRSKQGDVAYATYLSAAGANRKLVATLLCRPCDGSVPGLDRRYGPFIVRSVHPTVYFAGPVAHSIVVTHEAPVMVISDAEMRRPVEQLLDGLNEDSLLVASY